MVNTRIVNVVSLAKLRVMFVRELCVVSASGDVQKFWYKKDMDSSQAKPIGHSLSPITLSQGKLTEPQCPSDKVY